MRRQKIDPNLFFDPDYDERLTAPPKERGFLVAAEVRSARSLLSAQDSLDELELLAQTAGIEVVGRAVQHLQRIDPATYIGSGKVREVQEQIALLGANIVIFDDELSPNHQRELEKIFGESVKVIDRSALILDIFAQHARTREGALQVELAQYQYRLPRLTRQWTHLARQVGGGGGRSGNGGVGLRGPGETQLELTAATSRSVSPSSNRRSKPCAPIATAIASNAPAKASRPSPWSATPTPASPPSSTP